MDPSTTILWWWALGTPSTSKYVNLECLKFFNSVFSNPRGSIASGGQGYFTHSSYDYNTGYSRTNYKDWTELDWVACLSSHALKWSMCDKFFIDLKEYSIIKYLFNQPNSIALYLRSWILDNMKCFGMRYYFPLHRLPASLCGDIKYNVTTLRSWEAQV